MLGKVIHRVVYTNPKLDCEVLATQRLPEDRLLFVEKFETQPTVTPRIIEAHGGINPEAGVAATSPEMVPEHYIVPNVSTLNAFGWKGTIPNQPYSTFEPSASLARPK